MSSTFPLFLFFFRLYLTKLQTTCNIYTVGWVYYTYVELTKHICRRYALCWQMYFQCIPDFVAELHIHKAHRGGVAHA